MEAGNPESGRVTELKRLLQERTQSFLQFQADMQSQLAALKERMHGPVECVGMGALRNTEESLESSIFCLGW